MADLIQYWILDPAALVFLISLVTIVLLFRNPSGSVSGSFSAWRVALFVVWLAAFLMSSAPSIVNPLLGTLEDQYPASHSCKSGSHIVVLGGGVDSRATSAWEFERMSKSTMARATAAARIALAEPDAQLVASGGALKTVSEADVIATYWVALGISDERIAREVRSGDTRENASNVAELIDIAAVQGPVRLVTSALHMPRALLTFQSVFESTGVEFCPVSVDREALARTPVSAWLPQTTALVKFDKWLHELVALAMYRLRGWI